MVKPEKLAALQERMKKLGISDKDLIVKYVLGSGAGGQKINKTHSTVYIKHIPTGLEIKCQQTRSQALNHYYAQLALCEKLEKLLLNEKTAKEKEAAKIKRQKKRRSRRSKEKMLEEKKEHSEKKRLRRPPKE